MKAVLKKLYLGISAGCTIFVIMGLLFSIFGDGSMLSNEEFIKQAIASMIVGAAFVVPTVIYENTKIALPLRIIVHMGTGMILYVIVALNVGWIPTDYGTMPIIIAILSMVATSFAVWAGFYIYYRKEARKINEKIKNAK